MNEKCIHNKVGFCCICKYGKIREIENPHTFDLVDEIRIDSGYKLLKGYFGDISTERD